jgi:hypothetical protein
MFVTVPREKASAVYHEQVRGAWPVGLADALLPVKYDFPETDMYMCYAMLLLYEKNGQDTRRQIAEPETILAHLPSFYETIPPITHYAIRTDSEKASLNHLITKKKDMHEGKESKIFIAQTQGKENESKHRTQPNHPLPD